MADQPTAARIEVWMDEGGTHAVCTCGWRKSMPAGILPQVVMTAAEKHQEETGHEWPTEAEDGEAM